MSPSRDAALVGGIALAILGVLWWAKNRIVAAVDAGAINPGNPDNLVNAAVEGVVQAATGDNSQTLVGWFDDLFGINQGLAPGETIDPVSGQIVPVRRSASAADVAAFDASQSITRMQGMVVY
jgi:hypothetical protein